MNEDILMNTAKQEQFNSLMIQLMLDIKSRQIALQMFIASRMDGDMEAMNRIEEVASELRIDAVKELYSQFGEIHPDIMDLLNPKP